MKNKAGPLALTAILYFTVSGGPFGLEPLVASTGPLLSMILLLVVPLVWAWPTVLMVAELSAALPVEGGFYRWVERAMGRFWGFQEAWWSWACSVPDMAIYPVMFAGYLGRFYQLATLERWLLALGVIWLSVLLNLLGIRTVGATAIFSLVFLILPFGVFSLVALRQPAHAGALSFPMEGAALLVGLSTVLWNYTGWDNISLVGEEVERPERSYPVALMAAFAMIVALYILPVVAGLRVSGLPQSWQEGSFPTLAEALPGGEWLGRWVLAGALVSSFTLFNSLLLSYSRLPLAVAQDGLLPAWLKRVDQRGVPRASVVASAALYSVIALLGFSRLVVLYVLLYTLSLVLEFMALWLLRRQEPDLPRPFRIAGGRAGLILVTAPPLAVGAAVLAFTFWEARTNPAWMALAIATSFMGVPLYWLLKTTKTPRHQGP